MSGKKYVLVDFENIQPANLDRLRDRGFTLRVFLGSVQERIPVRIVNALQGFGSDLEYVQVCGVGPNALDFHIAYFLGRHALITPDAQFFVISNDTGFDPLLQQLRNEGVYARRVTSVGEISEQQALLEAVHSLSAGELLQKVLHHLARRPATRPRTLKTLRSSINGLFGKKLLVAQIDAIIAELQNREVISEAPGGLHYELPPAEAASYPLPLGEDSEAGEGFERAHSRLGVFASSAAPTLRIFRSSEKKVAPTGSSE